MRPNDPRLWAILATVLLLGGGLVFFGRRGQVDHEDEAQDTSHGSLRGTIRIGVLISCESLTPVYEFLTGMALNDINEYCAESGYDCSFEFVYTCAEGTGGIALEHTQMYKATGIDLVVGYAWSSHICVTTSYAEANEMVLLSPSSTSPTCAVKDTVFRLCPHDFKQATPMVRMTRSLGVSDAVVIQRKDSYGDGLAESFMKGFEADGGRVIANIRFAIETKSPDFEPYLEEADAAIRGILEEHDPGNAAILLICFSEDGQILEQASGHPALMGVRWFGSEEAVNSSGILETSRSIAVKVGMMSPIPSTADNSVYKRVNRAFVDEFNMSLGYYDANIYDCCWVMALSVLEAGSAAISDA